MKPKLYLETTIPSYLTARQSRDPILLGHQKITVQWWKNRRGDFDIFISQVVLDEAAMGSPDAAKRRLKILNPLRLLEAKPEVEALAQRLIKGLAFPKTAARDAAHLAFSAVHGMDFIMTWNCTHIANAQMESKIRKVCLASGYEPPIICTPEELMVG